MSKMADKITVYDTLQWVHAYITKTNASPEETLNWLRHQMAIIADGANTDPRRALRDLKGGAY